MQDRYYADTIPAMMIGMIRDMYTRHKLSVRDIARMTGYGKSFVARLCKDIVRNREDVIELSFENKPLPKSDRALRHRARNSILKQGIELNSNQIVHHKNEDLTDYSPENLQIMTRAEHNRHHVKTRAVPRGIEHTSSKLSEKDVIEIYKSKLANVHLAEFFRVTPQSIGQIKNGKKWAWLTKNIER
jgi:hypothetical protein